MAPQQFTDVEVLGDDEPTESLSDRLWSWLRARPVALVPVAAVLVAGAAFVLIHELRGPGLPALSITADSSPSTALASTRPWRAGHDNRPSGPVVLALRASVQEAGSGASSGKAGAGHSTTSVLGISGPAVLGSGTGATRLVAGKPVTVSLRAVLDCAALPSTTTQGDYTLRVRTTSGARSHTGTVDAGAAGEQWRRQVELACDSWLARRDLTVSALTASVSPTAAQLDLQLTLTNEGKRSITVATPAGDQAIRVSGPLPLRVPAGGTAQVRLNVVLNRCNSVAAPVNDTARLGRGPRLSSLVDLVALAGAAPFGSTAISEADGSGAGPTGIVLAPAAEKALSAALSSACGLIDPPLPSIPRGSSVTLNAETGEVVVPVQIHVAPGRVQSLRLDAGSARPTENSYRPLWKPIGRVAPDATGAVQVNLHYQVPISGACPGFGAYLPPFFVTAWVAAPGGTRAVRYEQNLDIGTDPGAIPLLCDSAGGADGQARSAATRSDSIPVPEK